MDQASSTAIVPIRNEQENVQEVLITESYSTNNSNLGSLVRLVIGGLVLGYDELMVRLNEWEKLISHQQNITAGENSDTPISLDQEQVFFINAKSPNSEENDRLIFAVFGLLSERHPVLSYLVILLLFSIILVSGP